MFISDYFGIPRGHDGFDFVDVTTTGGDSCVFLDPCLIENANDALSREAAAMLSSFADRLFWEMRYGDWQHTRILDHAHEVHETILGYGNGRNGRGRTPSGMKDSLFGLYRLTKRIESISKIQDISVFVEDFAEDRLSDLITNILRRLLIRFTAEQMTSYGILPSGRHLVWSWSIEHGDWIETLEPYWLVDGRKILLVPKYWVRKNYLFSAHQYLSRVIIERIREDENFHGVPKNVIRRNLERETYHWEYDHVVSYTQEHPDALETYHDQLPRYYHRANGSMSDEELDDVIYRSDAETA